MFTRRLSKTLCVIILPVLFVSAGSSNVLVDSEDWKDVYTGMFYTQETLDRGEPYFVSDESASGVISGEVLPAGNVTILESEDDPFSGGMDSRLETQPEDYNVREVIEFQDASQDLIPEDQDKFIVVPSDRPAAAVIAAPLARVTDSWVLFANNENLNEISNTVQDASNVITIGSFNREIESTLSQYANEQITSRSSQNLSIKVAKRFSEEKKFSRMMITPARELSPELFFEERPVLITKTTTPLSQSIIDYVESEDSIQTLFLANPQYSVVGSALNDEVEEEGGRSVSVLVHFGQARGDQGSVDAPSLFPLPSKNIDLNVDSVTYDPKRGVLLVSYANPSNAKVFGLTESLNIINDQNESIASAFDSSTFLMGGESSVTRKYDVDLSSDQVNQNLSAQLITTYGNNPDTREISLTNEQDFRPPYTTDVQVEEVDGDSNISLESVVYSERLGRFKAELRNNADSTGYATVSLREILVRGEQVALTKSSGAISPGEVDSVYLTPDTELDRVDIQQNDEILVEIQYGSKENVKLNSRSSRVDFRSASGLPIVGSFGAATTGAASVIILLLVLIAVEYKTGRITNVLRG